MDNRSLARELSLISLGLIKDQNNIKDVNPTDINMDNILEFVVDSLTNHCRQELDECEASLELTTQNLLDSELRILDKTFFETIREDMQKSLLNLEVVMNRLSDALEFPKMIALSDQIELRKDINKRITSVIDNFSHIDNNIDDVMEGWRFKRLPRIDRDILRLAYVDIYYLSTPISVACNEAVNLANKYSDTKGRQMINGVLRRLQKKV